MMGEGQQGRETGREWVEWVGNDQKGGVGKWALKIKDNNS